MRYVGAALIGLLLATAAHGQALVFGAAGMTTWEINPDSRPAEDWLHNSSVTPSVFVGVPITSDTMVRLRGFDLPRELRVGDEVFDSRLRGVTVGVDYLMMSVFGRTAFSGGIGGYELDVEGTPGAADLETWDFGWFVGIGEWIPMTRNCDLTFELAYHNTSHPGRPQLLSVSLGLALAF